MKVDNVIGNVSQAAAVQSVAGPKLQTTPDLARAVRAINAAKLFGYDSELTFAMDRETRRTVVRLIDKKTGELIRQIPAETVLRMSQSFNKSIK